MTERKSAKQTLTPLELKIMQVLWREGPSKVAEVQAALQAELAYTTVQTMLNILLRKGQVKRSQEGRAFRYRPVVSREGATEGAVADLVRRMFGGSTEALLMTMVDARQINARQLELLAKKVADAERRERTEVPRRAKESRRPEQSDDKTQPGQKAPTQRKEQP